MKRANIKMIALVALLAFLGLGLRPVAANNLESVGIARLGDSIAVTITTSADCEYNAFLTDSKPERIVIDLSGVLNDLPQKQFVSLPLKSFRSIRTSQFRSEPDLQARVVLDIKRPIDFRSFQNGNSIVIKFPAAADELASVNWESSGQVQAVVSEPMIEKPKPVVERPVAPPPQRVEVKPVEKPAAIVEAPPQIPIQKPVEKPVVVVQKPVENIPEPEAVADAVPVNEPEAVPQQMAMDDPAAVPQGIEVDTSAKRKTVEYAAEDEKDPFSPLVGIGMTKGNIKVGIPSLENLKLVGILEDTRSIGSALLEDNDGNGYILKPNDKVQSGYLVSVTDNKAIFQISEYGWTRTVALELQVPEIK